MPSSSLPHGSLLKWLLRSPSTSLSSMDGGSLSSGEGKKLIQRLSSVLYINSSTQSVCGCSPETYNSGHLMKILSLCVSSYEIDMFDNLLIKCQVLFESDILT